MKELQSPCKECAFRRDITPGALGGSPVETYIGQAFGPFQIPCHKACNFSDPNCKQASMQVQQCAGVAVFRSNLGIAHIMPDGLHSLPADKVTVFSDPAEFIAHHLQISRYEALIILSVYTPQKMMVDQLSRCDNILVEKK